MMSKNKDGKGKCERCGDYATLWFTVAYFKVCAPCIAAGASARISAR